MQRTIDRLLAEEEFDVIQIESSQMAGFDYGSSALLLVDEHNIEYELLYRTFKTEQSPVRKLYNWVEYRKFRYEEQRSWKHCDGCIVTSDREDNILRRHAPNTPTLVVPNGVDIDFFRPSALPVDNNSIVFVGVMHYRPNVDAALYFAREVLPLLVRERPNLKFRIVGAGPPEELRRLACRNIEVTGRVADTRPYTAAAGACVVPLRMGSGTRLKVLEGLAMGRPMVSTSLGCEGIATVDGEHLLIADEAAAFARSVLRILDEAELASRLAQRGRALVEERYSWPSVLADLEQFVQTRRQVSDTRGKVVARTLKHRRPSRLAS